MERIQMITNSAGPNGVMAAGKVYPVSDAEAEQLVSGGYARYVVPPAPAVRVAVKPPEPEDAVRPEVKHVGGGWYEYNGQKVRKADLPEGVL